MSEDIFVPTSKPEDALVGPLHTITYVTADKAGVETLLSDGYGFGSREWTSLADRERSKVGSYLGFSEADFWEVNAFSKQGAGANAQVRVLQVTPDKPMVRPAYDGLYHGGATMSCPMTDMRAHEAVMERLGIRSTMGVKEMEFTSPAGETYTSGEIVYLAPEYVFMMGVTRPRNLLPVGPIDPHTGIGGPAYSARCVTGTDTILEFLREVMGYEIRRDVDFVVGEQSAINMPEGTSERFVQAFAPGSNTGYVVLMDHGDATKPSPASHLGSPSRGIAMWSFPTTDIFEVLRRAKGAGINVVHPPSEIDSPFLGAKRVMQVLDPDGFPIEFFETQAY